MVRARAALDRAGADKRFVLRVRGILCELGVLQTEPPPPAAAGRLKLQKSGGGLAICSRALRISRARARSGVGEQTLLFTVRLRHRRLPGSAHLPRPILARSSARVVRSARRRARAARSRRRRAAAPAALGRRRLRPARPGAPNNLRFLSAVSALALGETCPLSPPSSRPTPATLAAAAACRPRHARLR